MGVRNNSDVSSSPMLSEQCSMFAGELQRGFCGTGKGEPGGTSLEFVLRASGLVVQVTSLLNVSSESSETVV